MKSTERVRPLVRRRWWPPLAVVAALLLVLAMWFARRPGTERVVQIERVEAAPKIVTVPVMVPVPAPPAPVVPPPVHVQVRAAPKPAPVAPAPAVPPVQAPVASDVVSRYRDVGQLLRAHGTDDLWRRYRWIRLGDCLTTDAKRAECVKMLDAIASDAAGK